MYKRQPLALLLMKLPFLSNAKQAVAAPTPAVGTLSGKLGTISLVVVGMLIPAIIFPAVYDGSLTAEPIRWRLNRASCFSPQVMVIWLGPVLSLIHI